MPFTGVTGSQATKHITAMIRLFTDGEFTVKITQIFMGNTIAKQDHWW
jgi:hypothetical protein